MAMPDPETVARNQRISGMVAILHRSEREIDRKFAADLKSLLDDYAMFLLASADMTPPIMMYKPKKKP